MVLVFAPDAPLWRGMSTAEDYTVSQSTATDVVSAAGSSTTSTLDRTVRRDTGAITADRPAFITHATGEVVQWTSLTPAVATISVDGSVVTPVATGRAVFEATGRYGTRRYTGLVVFSGPSAVDTVIGYQPGSLARHIWDGTLALIDGKTPSDETLLNYSTRTGDYNSSTVVRNASSFAAGIDLSGMSVWRSESANNGYWPCAAVGPRHTICANHTRLANGVPYGYGWYTPAGEYIQANVVSRQQIGTTDILVEYLDRDLPASIKRFKVLPSNYRSYLPSSTSYRLPTLSKRQAAGVLGSPTISTARYDALRVLSCWFADSTSGNVVHLARVPQYNQLDASVPWAAWEWPLHTGDSSGPSWFVINGEAVLLGHYYNVEGSPHIGDYLTEIDAAMVALATAAGDATPYALQRASLAGFAVY